MVSSKKFLTDSQILDFARGVRKNGLAFYERQFKVSRQYLRNVLASLRKHGAKIGKLKRESRSSRYATLLVKLKK